MKESAAHCNVALLFLCSCLELILGYVAYRAAVTHVFGLSVTCDAAV
jgi:hypothetical protein